MARLLEGRRVLVLEDEFLAALDMADCVEARGGEVVGPVGQLDQALELVRSEPLDVAILDVRLNELDSFPVADALAARQVPFVFATGYDRPLLPARFRDFPVVGKPVDGVALDKALAAAIGRS